MISIGKIIFDISKNTTLFNTKLVIKLSMLNKIFNKLKLEKKIQEYKKQYYKLSLKSVICYNEIKLLNSIIYSENVFTFINSDISILFTTIDTLDIDKIKLISCYYKDPIKSSNYYCLIKPLLEHREDIFLYFKDKYKIKITSSFVIKFIRSDNRLKLLLEFC